MCTIREAEYRAMRTMTNIQNAEEWDRQRIEAGEPHPCQDCDRYCGPSCRFFGVKGTYKPEQNQHVNKIFRDILNQYARRVCR